jgi:50S ribosomal protein L16 3-hydroxylase
MDITLAAPLLGGLTPQIFMRRHWQKRPLLVRRAVPDAMAIADRAKVFELAARDGVESRLITHDHGRWSLRHGPFKRRALPSLKQARWTLLVQGVDAQLDEAHRLMSRFRFVPDARLDDLMLSYASDGGGVGPHFDSYDVFLLQLEGCRRWRIGRLADPVWRSDVPLKILSNFVAEQEWLLEPGDMLYLPPRWAHDGVARGECITASIGFRAAGRERLGREVLQRMLDAAEAAETEALYRDTMQSATKTPGRVPPALQSFAENAAARIAADPRGVACALGEVLSEPKAGVWFDQGRPLANGRGVLLDRRTRMMYDARHVFVNGESYRASGRDATLMRSLANQGRLAVRDVDSLSGEARGLLNQWARAGWLHACPITD